MKTPHSISGWAKIGIHPIDMLKPKEQEKLINVGDRVSRSTKYKHILFVKIGSVTPSNERPLAMMYHRRKSVKTKQKRINPLLRA